MDSSFQDQKDPRVKSLVKDHFQGQYTYVTQCQFCQQESPRPCSFFELELRISECRSIQESLLCFTGAEYLTGDNQYFCSSCQTKRDALRFIRIEAVPPVLNLQLMRFVFDMESLTKKKLRNKIVFPETLDMRPYVASASDEPLLYDLKAVLLHRGSTADSGHYVVRIRDTPQDSINSMTDSNGPSSSNPPKSDSNWFDFDDESVTPMDKVVFELDEGTSSGASTTTTPKKSSAKKRKVKEDEVPLNLNPGEFASATAYLLTYVRRSHSYQVESVPEIMDVVHASNVVFENECDTYDKRCYITFIFACKPVWAHTSCRKNEQTRVFIEKQSMLKSLFSSWSVSCDSVIRLNKDFEGLTN